MKVKKGKLKITQPVVAKPMVVQNKVGIFTLRNFLIFLLVVRFISGIFYSLVPLHGLHIWRQTDVLSVAYSYYLRFFVEHNFEHFFLPSVLNTDHGEFSIVRMEFPLLNFILSPCFIFGPYYGKVIANIMVLVLNYALVIFNYRLLRNVKVSGIPIAYAVLLLPNFSFTATWTTRIMPDVFSMLLVLTAVSLSWEKKRPYASFIFASLGLLVKPTSIIVLLLIFLKSDTFKQTIKSKTFITDVIWCSASTIVAMAYYFVALHYLKQFEVHSHFNVSMNDPLTSLSSFFSADGLAYLFGMRFLCPPYINWLIPNVMELQFMILPYLGLVIFGGAMLLYLIFKQSIIAWRVIIVLIVQILFIAALDGEHSFVHFYYYVGTTFAFAIVFIGYLMRVWTWYKPLLFAVLLLQFFDILNFEIGDYYTRHFQWSPQSRVAFYDECSALQSRNPNFPWHQGYVFNGPKTDNEQAADLGICFGEREEISGLAKYGFYYNWDEIPSNCQEVDRSEHIVLVTCQ